MTPKDKAEELVEKFAQSRKSVFPDSVLHIKHGKQDALIAVEEQIKEVVDGYSYSDYRKKYWQEVKQEIEKL